MKLIECYGDGSCYNSLNKNSMGIGGVIHFGDEVITFSKFVGYGTSNKAEWQALIHTLEVLKNLSIENLDTFHFRYHSDSQVIVNIFNDLYSNRNFMAEYDCAKRLVEGFKKGDRLTVKWIPRELNKQADELSKKGNPYFKNN